MRDSAQAIPLHQTPFSGKYPRKPKNQDARPREYLTEDEVDRLMKAARSTGRHGFRDSTMILLAYRHGLRVSELVALKWDQIDLKQGQFAVVRAKNGTPSTHPLRRPEICALRRLKRVRAISIRVCYREEGTTHGIRRQEDFGPACEKAGLEFSVHPLMLRHGCGFKLATPGRTPRRSTITCATSRSSIRSGTLNWRRSALRGFGPTDED